MEKSNILIVDDVSFNREMLVEILKGEYNVYEASGGKEAIEMLSSRERIYRLVLLDIIMPGVDGFEVLKYMKEAGVFDSLPVIIISSDDTNETILKAHRLGAVDYFTKPFASEIITSRIHNILSVYEKNYKDSLTGGYNRDGFCAASELYLKKNQDQKYSIVSLDIKNFKAVNEVFGLDGGDCVLNQFYDSLVDSTLEPIIAARFGSDHFACLVKTDKLDEDYLLNGLESNIKLKGKNIHLYSRCGIYHIVDSDMPVSAMIDCAKLAEQNIKDESAKPYCVFDDSMKKTYFDQASVLHEFEDGIENEEFKVYYQPVVDAKTGALVSCEALVRWFHPEKGFITPGSFIPALEKTGHISRLDRHILKYIKSYISDRKKKNLPVVPVSINLSRMDFYDDKTLGCIMELLNKDAISQKAIRLEVTETSYAALEQNGVDLLEKFRASGAYILLDDFGSGYSSFGMLKDYNFDVLKIDMSFTRQIENNDKVKVIIQGIIDICHRLGIKVVAEGAETEKQVAFLRDNGCDYIQGYYFSKPLSEEDFEEYIRHADLSMLDA